MIHSGSVRARWFAPVPKDGAVACFNKELRMRIHIVANKKIGSAREWVLRHGWKGWVGRWLGGWRPGDNNVGVAGPTVF